MRHHDATLHLATTDHSKKHFVSQEVNNVLGIYHVDDVLHPQNQMLISAQYSPHLQ